MTPEEIKAMPTPYDPDEESRGFYGWSVPYRGNRGLAGAYRKGALAAVEGKTLHACPYEDLRTDRGAITFSRAFQRAWGEGWHRVMLGEEVACRLHPIHDGECETRPKR